MAENSVFNPLNIIFLLSFHSDFCPFLGTFETNFSNNFFLSFSVISSRQSLLVCDRFYTGEGEVLPKLAQKYLNLQPVPKGVQTLTFLSSFSDICKPQREVLLGYSAKFINTCNIYVNRLGSRVGSSCLDFCLCKLFYLPTYLCDRPPSLSQRLKWG